MSVACAEQALLPRLRGAPAEAVVLADGFSCRTQIHELDSGDREAMHLAELLAGATSLPATYPEQQAVRPVIPSRLAVARVLGAAVAAVVAFAAVRRRIRGRGPR